MHADFLREAAVGGYALEGAGIVFELAREAPGKHVVAAEIDAAENAAVQGFAEGD